MVRDAMGAGAAALDAGELPLGGGLLALLRPALDRLQPGSVVALRSTSEQVRDDLPAWCRIEHHTYLGRSALPDGSDRHLVERGPLSLPRPQPGTEREVGRLLPLRNGALLSAEVLAAVPLPERGDVHRNKETVGAFNTQHARARRQHSVGAEIECCHALHRAVTRDKLTPNHGEGPAIGYSDAGRVPGRDIDLSVEIGAGRSRLTVEVKPTGHARCSSVDNDKGCRVSPTKGDLREINGI